MRRISGGLLRGRRLDDLPSNSSDVRPTSARVRQAIFDHLQTQVDGTQVLDLFAGTGALAIEALSRGAQFATMVEIQPSIARFLQTQCNHLNVQTSTHIWQGDAFEFLQKRPKHFHKNYQLVFLDPPYVDPHKSSVSMTAIFSQLAQGWLSEQATIVYESSTISQDLQASLWTEDYTLLTHKIYGQTSLTLLQWSNPHQE